MYFLLHDPLPAHFLQFSRVMGVHNGVEMIIFGAHPAGLAGHHIRFQLFGGKNYS